MLVSSLLHLSLFLLLPRGCGAEAVAEEPATLVIRYSLDQGRAEADRPPGGDGSDRALAAGAADGAGDQGLDPAAGSAASPTAEGGSGGLDPSSAGAAGALADGTRSSDAPPDQPLDAPEVGAIEGPALAPMPGEVAAPDASVPAAGVPPAQPPSSPLLAASPPLEPAVSQPVPPPEPEEPPEPRWREFVENAQMDEGRCPEDAELIGARGTAAEQELRTLVTAEEEGALAWAEDAERAAESAESAFAQAGEELVAEGSPALGRGVESTSAVSPSGEGSARLAQPRPAGGLPAAPPARLPAVAQVAGHRGSAPSRGASGSAGGEQDTDEGTPWWDATSFRLADSAPASPATAGVRAVVAVSAYQAPPSAQPEAGPDEAPADASEDAVAEAVEAPPPPIRPGAADVVEELQDAFGWGGIDRAALYAPALAEGSESGGGGRSASGQVVLERAALGRRVAISASTGPLGAYQERIYQLVRASWYSQELTLEQRVAMPSGSTTVRFGVRATGKVEQLEIIQSSGVLSLDRMALAAVPRHLPRFPRALREERGDGLLWQEMIFRFGDGGRSPEEDG